MPCWRSKTQSSRRSLLEWSCVALTESCTQCFSALLQARQRVMRHVVVVQQIAFERCDIVGRAATLESHTIIYAGVVDERINLARRSRRLFNCLSAQVCVDQFNNSCDGLFPCTAQFGFKLSRCLFVTVNTDCVCSLLSRGSYDRGSDPFGSAGHNNGLTLEF